MSARATKAPLPKPRKLADLYTEAQCAYYGPILGRLEREGRIGPGGVTEDDLAGLPAYMNIERFVLDLRERGVEFRW